MLAVKRLGTLHTFGEFEIEMVEFHAIEKNRKLMERKYCWDRGRSHIPNNGCAIQHENRN